MHQRLHQKIIAVIRRLVQSLATRRYHFRKLDLHHRTVYAAVARASLSRLIQIVAVAAKGV